LISIFFFAQTCTKKLVVLVVLLFFLFFSFQQFVPIVHRPTL